MSEGAGVPGVRVQRLASEHRQGDAEHLQAMQARSSERRAGERESELQEGNMTSAGDAAPLPAPAAGQERRSHVKARTHCSSPS